MTKNQKIVIVSKYVKSSFKLNPGVVAEWSKTDRKIISMFK